METDRLKTKIITKAVTLCRQQVTEFSLLSLVETELWSMRVYNMNPWENVVVKASHVTGVTAGKPGKSGVRLVLVLYLIVRVETPIG